MVAPILHRPEVFPSQLDTVHQASSDARGLGKGMRLPGGVFQLLPRLLQPRRMLKVDTKTRQRWKLRGDRELAERAAHTAAPPAQVE